MSDSIERQSDNEDDQIDKVVTSMIDVVVSTVDNDVNIKYYN